MLKKLNFNPKCRAGDSDRREKLNVFIFVLYTSCFSFSPEIVRKDANDPILLQRTEARPLDLDRHFQI